MYGMSEIRYVTLTDETTPILLARVRWPDVAEAITLGRSEWQSDPGLFDLPYDRTALEVTASRAQEIATGWGARLPDGPSPVGSRPALIRRMPASWSNLTSAERKAWSLELSRVRRHNRRRHARRTPKGTRGPLRTLRAVLRRTPPVSSSPEDALADDPFIGDDLAAGSETGHPNNVTAGRAYANLNDPRLAGLRLPVGSAQFGEPEANPTPTARPRPGVQ
jgi:hypothetical protein